MASVFGDEEQKQTESVPDATERADVPRASGQEPPALAASRVSLSDTLVGDPDAPEARSAVELLRREAMSSVPASFSSLPPVFYSSPSPTSKKLSHPPRARKRRWPLALAALGALVLGAAFLISPSFSQLPEIGKFFGEKETAARPTDGEDQDAVPVDESVITASEALDATKGEATGVEESKPETEIEPPAMARNAPALEQQRLAEERAELDVHRAPIEAPKPERQSSQPRSLPPSDPAPQRGRIIRTDL